MISPRGASVGPNEPRDPGFYLPGWAWDGNILGQKQCFGYTAAINVGDVPNAWRVGFLEKACDVSPICCLAWCYPLMIVPTAMLFARSASHVEQLSNSFNMQPKGNTSLTSIENNYSQAKYGWLAAFAMDCLCTTLVGNSFGLGPLSLYYYLYNARLYTRLLYRIPRENALPPQCCCCEVDVLAVVCCTPCAIMQTSWQLWRDPHADFGRNAVIQADSQIDHSIPYPLPGQALTGRTNSDAGVDRGHGRSSFFTAVDHTRPAQPGTAYYTSATVVEAVPMVHPVVVPVKPQPQSSG